jgi:hypothetical protein
MSRIVIALAVLAMAVASVGCGNSSTQELTRDVTSKPGHGADKDSLFHSQNFAKALTALDHKSGGQKVLSLTLKSASLSSMVTNGKTFTQIVVTKEFHATDLGASGVTTGSPIAIASIKPDAPERMIQGLAGKGITLKDVDYVSVFGQGAKSSLQLFTLGAKGIYQADIDGSNVRPLGALPSSSGSGGGGASSAQTCLAKAGTDAVAIQKCVTG